MAAPPGLSKMARANTHTARSLEKYRSGKSRVGGQGSGAGFDSCGGGRGVGASFESTGRRSRCASGAGRIERRTRSTGGAGRTESRGADLESRCGRPPGRRPST